MHAQVTVSACLLTEKGSPNLGFWSKSYTAMFCATHDYPGFWAREL